MASKSSKPQSAKPTERSDRFNAASLPKVSLPVVFTVNIITVRAILTHYGVNLTVNLVSYRALCYL